MYDLVLAFYRLGKEGKTKWGQLECISHCIPDLGRRCMHGKNPVRPGVSGNGAGPSRTGKSTVKTIAHDS